MGPTIPMRLHVFFPPCMYFHANPAVKIARLTQIEARAHILAVRNALIIVVGDAWRV